MDKPFIVKQGWFSKVSQQTKAKLDFSNTISFSWSSSFGHLNEAVTACLTLLASFSLLFFSFLLSFLFLFFSFVVGQRMVALVE